MASGLRGSKGIAAPPYTSGPYTWDQHVTFTGGLTGANTKGLVKYVDGTAGSDSNSGNSWTEAYATIQAGVTAAGAYGVVYVMPMAMAAGSTDPGNYAEKIIIPATHECLSIVGIGNRTQGGLPQVKYGGTLTGYLLTIRSCGCTIANMGFNGNSTAGAPLVNGILLDDDGSTKSAYGTQIVNCHFKNCAGSTVTDARTGGAIVWSANGNAWQVWIHDNRFYKNVCDICLLGTSQTVPQDVIIENNIFSGPLASVDCHLWLTGGGSGMNGVLVRNNCFPCALPNLGSGPVHLYANMVGCVGMFSGNRFGSTDTTSGFGAARAVANIPTTVGIVENYSDGGLIVRQ
jgi:hypothetical protein